MSGSSKPAARSEAGASEGVFRGDPGAASRLADAASRALSAGVSGGPGQGGLLSRPLLQSGAGGRGHPPADPALRLRCGDHLLGHPRGAVGARPAGPLRRGRGPAARSCDDGRRSGPAAAWMGSRSVSRRSTRPSRGSGRRLPKETALIGFCGAPWTVATYMVAGQGTTDQAPARLWAYRDRAGFQQLIDLLVEASVEHLSAQVEAGADLLQIFDTWAGVLPDGEFERWVVAPTAPDRRGPAGAAALPCPIIGFPRGAGSRSAATTSRKTRVDAIGCDTAMPLSAMQDLREDAPLCKASSIRCCWSPAARPSTGRSIDARCHGGPPLHLQSRPRHRSADAAGACGAAGRPGPTRRRPACLRRHPPVRKRPLSAPPSRSASRSLLSSPPSGWLGADAYLWVKAVHVMAVIAWMAGMLYLPRLFVYHAEAPTGSAAVGNLQGHGAAAAPHHHQSGDGDRLGARPLARLAGGFLRLAWFHAKLALVVALSGLHGYLVGRRPQVRRGPQRAHTPPLAHDERGAGAADGGHRHPRHREAILMRH